MENPWNYVSDSHASHVIDAINELRKNKELCDVILVVNGHCIPAHRLILSACSPYFHGLFEGHSPSSHPLGNLNHPIEVPLSGIDACAAESAIDYCYTSHLVIDEQNVWSLLPAASLLQLEEVQNVCCDFLKGRLSLSNCVRMWLMSCSCHCQQLTYLCNDYLRENFERLLPSSEFLDISPDSLVTFLSQCLSQKIVNENLVCDAVQCWVNRDKEQRAPSLSMLSRRLSCVQKLFSVDNVYDSQGGYSSSVDNVPNTQRRGFLECQMCNDALPTQQALLSHVTERHSEPTLRTYQNANSLDEQKEVSSSKTKSQDSVQEESDIVCEICSKHYHSDIEMTNHCLGHMEGCSPAPEIAHTPAGPPCTLEERNSNGSSGTCQQPPESFLTNYKGEKRYCCKLCQEEAETESQMFSHCSDHHGNISPPIDCSLCQRSFNDRTKFLHHLVNHSTIIYFCCPFCAKQSRTKANLQIHMRIHTGERPFVCTFCNKGFRNYCVLKVHVRSHTGEKPFRCDLCGQCFTKNIHLKRHVSTHSGEKPFACDLCGKGFGRNDHLQRHIKTIHTQEKPHGCNICGKDFVRRYELDRHMRYHMKKGNVKEKGKKCKSEKNGSHEKIMATITDTSTTNNGHVTSENSSENGVVYERSDREFVSLNNFSQSMSGSMFYTVGSCPPNLPNLINLDNCRNENPVVNNNNNILVTDKRYRDSQLVLGSGGNLGTIGRIPENSDGLRLSPPFPRNKSAFPTDKNVSMVPNSLVLNPHIPTLQPNENTSIPFSIP